MARGFGRRVWLGDVRWPPGCASAVLLVALLCTPVETLTAQSRPFDIYWVDVEGGAATLVVAPTGESLLVDTGWDTDDDRDDQLG